MQNDMRDRLIEIIRKSHCVDVWDYWNDELKQPNPIETLADHLIKNGVVPVVHCKDCKHYKAQKQSINWKNKKKYCCRVVALKVNENDYCSYRETK